MTFSPAAWLAEPIAWINEQQEAETGPRFLRLCWLIYANDHSPFVRSWGRTSVAPDGHRRGLKIHEALELIRYTEFMNGIQTAGMDIGAIFKPLYDRYVADKKSTDPNP